MTLAKQIENQIKRTLNRCILISALALFAVASAHAVLIAWSQPTNCTPEGYIICHGDTSGRYEQFQAAGAGTNYDWSETLPYGENYFAAVYLVYQTNSETGKKELLTSSFSKEIVCTNTPVVALRSIVFTTTNFDGWQPFATNFIMLPPTNSQAHFLLGQMECLHTNQITAPPMPP